MNLDDRLPVDARAIEVMRLTRDVERRFRTECAERNIPADIVEGIVSRHLWQPMNSYGIRMRLNQAAQVLRDSSPDRHWDLFHALILAHQIAEPAGARIYELLYADKRTESMKRRKANEPKMAIGKTTRKG